MISEVYNVSVELVTYQWPAWLHQETEKQRVIWGYKILFLDVLFPLTVKKVIYVDADQVVRADIKELWEMDLQGAPLGYTPFCDSRKEMDGFRFWKSGYWKNHLGSKPYHIRFGWQRLVSCDVLVFVLFWAIYSISLSLSLSLVGCVKCLVRC